MHHYVFSTPVVPRTRAHAAESYRRRRLTLTYVHESLHPQQRTGPRIADAELVRDVVVQHETQTEGTEGIQELEEEDDTDLTGQEEEAEDGFAPTPGSPPPRRGGRVGRQRRPRRRR